MKIELSVIELERLYASFRQVLDETRDASYMRWRKECVGQDGPRPSGWVSHPVSTDNPPSVMTVATAGADGDVGKAVVTDGDVNPDGESDGGCDWRTYDEVCRIVRESLDTLETWVNSRLCGRRLEAEVLADGFVSVRLSDPSIPGGHTILRHTYHPGSGGEAGVIAGKIIDQCHNVVFAYFESLSYDDYVSWLSDYNGLLSQCETPPLTEDE